MVFQDYALFPWMTVRQNIGFGPRQRGLPRREVDEIVDAFVELVGLERFADALSAPAFRRHEAARRHRPRARQQRRDPADGRAVRRARRADARAAAGRASADLGAHRASPSCSSPIPSRRRSLLADRVLVMSAGPGPDRERHRDRPAAAARRVVAGVQRGPPRPRAPAHQSSGAAGRARAGRRCVTASA